MLVVFDNDFEKLAFDDLCADLPDYIYLPDYSCFDNCKYIKASPDVPFRAISIEVANYLVDLQKREEYK